MRKIEAMKKLVAAAFTLLLSAEVAYAQINPNFPSGSPEDIQLLGDNYLSPFANFLQAGLNNGWYQTAKPHNLGRFDIMITPSFIFIPEVDKSFTVSNADLTSLELANSSISSASTPTVFGDTDPGPSLVHKDDPTGNSEFELPGGIGSLFSVVPMFNASVGLFKNTEVSVRYVPEIGIPIVDEGKFDLLGFAIKHDLTQWIPGEKVLPVDISAFGGYTQLNFSQELSVGADPNDEQSLELESTAWTGRLLVSKKILFVTPYVGFGYNGGNTTLDVLGDYTYETEIAGIGFGEQTISNPISVEEDAANGFIGNVGARFKFLGVIALSADYTFGPYDALTTGVGVSVDF